MEVKNSEKIAPCFIRSDHSARRNRSAVKNKEREGFILKKRRVGTLTMGLALVAIGVLVLISLFIKSFDLIWVLRFSPVILIFLGIEILVASFQNKEKLQYDGLSIALSIILIVGTLLTSVGVQAYDTFVSRAGEIRAAERKVEEDFGVVLQGVAEIESYSASSNGNGVLYMVDGETAPDFVNYHVEVSASDTPQAFVQKARTVLAAMGQSDLIRGRIWIEGTNRANRDLDFEVTVRVPGGCQISEEALLDQLD